MTRDEAITIIGNLEEKDILYNPCDVQDAKTMAIEALEQEPKIGHWIKSNIPNEKYVCSECGGACWYYDYQADVAKSRFCPNCGCRMVEPQESEDAE